MPLVGVTTMSTVSQVIKTHVCYMINVIVKGVTVNDVTNVVWSDMGSVTFGHVFPDSGHDLMLIYLPVQNELKRVFTLPVPHTLPPRKRHDVFFQFRG